MILKVFTNSKVICHFRTSSSNDVSLKKRVYYNIMKFIINNFSDEILFVSSSSRNKAFPNSKKTKTKILYNGFAEVQNMNLNRVKISHVGRFIKDKNQLFLLEICKKLPSEKFYFVGKNSTDYFKECEKYILDNNLRNAYIEGELNNVNKILQETKIFLFPSTREGLPGALIEAANNGCNIIASNIEENIEVQNFYPDNITTLPLDTNSWVEKIKELNLKNNSFPKSKFSMDKYVENLSNIYISIMR